MALTMVICTGLPASGKSSFSAARVAEGGWIDVNKDVIRDTLSKSGWSWSQGNETRDVIPARNGAIRGALEQGINVVSSDTNFGGHVQDLTKIGNEYGAEVIVQHFPITLKEAIERDSKRGDKSVGAKVIENMAKRHQPAGAFPPTPVPARTPAQDQHNPMPAFLIDLDGTCCLHTGRSPYATERCLEDKVNQPVLDVIRALSNDRQWKPIYASGREDKFRDLSLTWLDTHGFPAGPLFMRPTGDFRKDYVIKEEIYRREIEPFYSVQLCLDDRDSVCAHYRSMGLVVFQVAPGAF